MCCREFDLYVDSVEITEYEKSRDLFANPVAYYKRDVVKGKKNEKKLKLEFDKKLKTMKNNERMLKMKKLEKQRFDKANYKNSDAESDFEYSFYGPVESERESVSEASDIIEERQNEYMRKTSKKGYFHVSETHYDHLEFKWSDTPTANRIRGYMLTHGS